MKYKSSSPIKGFTIIEVLIATAIFSVVLLVFIFSFVRVSQVFYKGVSMGRVQEAARNTLRSIADDIQFTKSTPSPNPPTDYFCIADHRYAYFEHVKVGSGPLAGVYRENVGLTCPTLIQQPVNPSTADQMLNNGMQLNDLAVNCPTGGADGSCSIRILVVYYGSDDTVLIPSPQAPDAHCSGPAISAQLCATALYQSTVLQSF